MAHWAVVDKGQAVFLGGVIYSSLSLASVHKLSLALSPYHYFIIFNEVKLHFVNSVHHTPR